MKREEKKNRGSGEEGKLVASVTELKERLALYLAAEKVVLESNQSYQIGQQSYTKANLAMLQAEIRRIEARLELLEQQHGSYSAKQVIIGGRR